MHPVFKEEAPELFDTLAPAPAYQAGRDEQCSLTLLLVADNSKLGKMVALGEIIVGAGFILRGIGKIREPSANGGLLGRGPAQAKALPQPRVIEKATLKQVRNIDERVAEIQKLIQKGSLNPAIEETVSEILSRKCGEKWCVREKDYLGEVSALFWAMRDPASPNAMRYRRDHVRVDQFHGADKLLKLRTGDCDDGVILLGSMLQSAGYPVKLRIIQTTDSATWSHVYALAGLPPTNPTRWLPLDWSVEDSVPGWEAPGAKEAASTGKPAGIVAKVRDFDV